MVKYVPLHLHTEYSLLDGAIKIPDLYKFCAENDMPAVAITDHGVMYGCADMFIAKNEMMSHMLSEEEQELKNKIAAVKPILGCEFYVCDGPVEGEESKVQKTRYHLVLLAKNQAGYHALCKLDSFASTDGFYFKPRINHEKLEEVLNEGGGKGNIVCLSACIQGEVSRNYLDGHQDEAEERVKYYHSLFGDDYYIELQDHDIPEEKQVNPFLMEMAEKYGIKTVITNDSHFLLKEDYLWHDTLICEQTKSKKTDTDRLTFSKELYVKTVDELREAFSWMEEDYFNKCIEATVEIADKVDFEMDKLEFNKTKEYLPKYPCPDGLTEEEYFDKLCIEGLKKRYGDPIPESIMERYEYEKGVIFKMGFPAYFLLTWDFINWAKERNIPVGPGRGSAAGSIVAYALRITELDPIEHKLLFERFLNPERISMPDIDIDFCKRDRGLVIDYVAEKWGHDHVCQIITFGTLAAKAALKAVARVYDIDFTTSNKWAGLIPSAPGTKLKDALQEGTEFKKLYDENPEAKKLIEEALHLEGLKNQVGTHAAGVIIAPDAMSNIIPVAYAKEKETKDKVVKKSTQTQYPMAGIEKIGLLKMDFLGLETLTIMRDCLDMVKKRTGKDVDINNISLKDEKTFELLKQGETDGVFQLESPGMRRVAKDLKPSVFEDLGALVAIFRPGPIEAGMVKDFVERKHGRQKIEYAHPLLEPILKETYGTILYQEQIMQIFQTLADYSLGDADMVRRMMGKKKLQQMAEQKERFVKASASKGMTADAATKLFEQIEAFAKYCFNKAHSSAYGFIAYQTAYLKAHYPVEWMAAMLTSQADDQEKTQQYILQCNKLGIEVLPPDINKSEASFTPDGNNIRFGLASVKNVGRGVVETIMKVREGKDFESFYDYCSRMQGTEARALNKLTLEALIKVGAFSQIEKSRKQLIENYERVLKDVAKKKDAQNAGQVSLFALAGENAQDLGIPTFELTGDSNDEFLDTEIQQFEHDLMGIYVTSHPLSSIKDTLKYLTTDSLTEILQNPVNDQLVTICGLLSRVASKPTKKDPSKILKTGTIEDLSGGRMEFVVFPKTVEKYGQLIQSEEKLILTAKVQIRDEEVNLIVQEVKPIQNVNLVTLKLLEDLQFEELVYLKELLAKYSGEDPVVVDFMDEESLSEDKRVQILTNKHLWVKADESLQNGIKGYFKDRIELEIVPLTK